MTFRHLPLMLKVFSFNHSPSLQTESKACLKSMKQQNSFALFERAMSIKLLIMNKLSAVE